MDTIINYKNGTTLNYDLNEQLSIEIPGTGVELKGLSAVNFDLALKHKSEPIAKIMLPEGISNARKVELRKHIPSDIILEYTKDLQADTVTRTSDLYERISELAPSAPLDLKQEAKKRVESILENMDWINNNVFKPFKPVNATGQGYIKHHFPSPKFSTKDVGDAGNTK